MAETTFETKECEADKNRPAKTKKKQGKKAIDAGERPENCWSLSVDGSSGKVVSGAGILLTAPEGQRFKRALRFKFAVSNNQAEYEALIAGLELARDMKVSNLIIRSDSQLVVNQVKGEHPSN